MLTDIDSKTALVSVVIPAYNSGGCLDETLTALEGQVLRDVEIICVDDGSTDNTLEIAQRHAANDQRVKVLHQENAGAGVARNTGFALAKGKWVAFLDADDIYKTDYLSKMVEAAESCNAEMAICDADCLIEKTGEIKPWEYISSKAAGSFVKTKDCAEFLFQLTPVVPFNKLFKSSFVRGRDLQFQSLSNCNDMFFTCSALIGAETVALVHEPLVAYRISEGASIQDNFVKRPTREKCLCSYRALSALRDFCISGNLLNDRSIGSLESLMIVTSFAATTKALGHDKLLRDIFSFYQVALKSEWRVSKPAKNAGFEVRSKYELMVNSTVDQFAWVYKEAGKSRSGGLSRKALLGAKAAVVITQNKLHGKN